MMIKTLLSFVFSGIIAISFSAHSKTKVTWSMESNADRDPIFLEKLQNAYNSAQNNYELEIQFGAGISSDADEELIPKSKS